MTIERIGDEVIIRLPSSIDTKGLQLLIDFLIFKNSTEKSTNLKSRTDEEFNTRKENKLIYEMSNSCFANVWAEDEPEYSLNDIKTVNPDYEGG